MLGTRKTNKIARRQGILSSGGRQSARNRTGQLIEDGLKPDDHVARALALEHPFTHGEAPSAAVESALDQPMTEHDLITYRRQVCEALEELAGVVAVDDIESAGNPRGCVVADDQGAQNGHREQASSWSSRRRIWPGGEVMPSSVEGSLFARARHRGPSPSSRCLTASSPSSSHRGSVGLVEGYLMVVWLPVHHHPTITFSSS